MSEAEALELMSGGFNGPPAGYIHPDPPGVQQVTSHGTYHGVCSQCGNGVRVRLSTAINGPVKTVTCPSCGYMMLMHRGSMTDLLETK